MFKQIFIQLEQAHHRTHQAHIPALLPPRRHLAPPLKGGLSSPNTSDARWKEWAAENNICQICGSERSLCGGEEKHG